MYTKKIAICFQAHAPLHFVYVAYQLEMLARCWALGTTKQQANI